MADNSVKPLPLWTARELRQKLDQIFEKVPRSDLRKLQPLLEKVREACERELADAERNLANFKIVADFDVGRLEALAELFSRPQRLAVQAAHDKLFVAKQALRFLAGLPSQDDDAE